MLQRANQVYIYLRENEGSQSIKNFLSSPSRKYVLIWLLSTLSLPILFKEH